MANDQLSALLAALADPQQRARLPAGMRNNNPGNIKYVGQAGTRPSVNTDQGDPQAVYASPEAGMQAMASLLRRKYDGGKRTANDIIAGQGGWTPGNFQAAANVARTAGIAPNADINFSDPQMASRFMRGLMLQEHGQSSQLYPDSLITASISGSPLPPPSPYAGMADGPKGQEAYAQPVLGPSPQPSPLGPPGIPNDVAQYAAADDQKTLGQRLQSVFGGLERYPDAPQVRFGPMGDARNSGGDLLKALNAPTLSDLLAQKRLG